MPRALVLVLLAASLVGVWMAAPASVATTPGTPGPLIVFDAGPADFETDIYTIHTDGTGLTQLTTNGAVYDDEGPAWSPDGTQIAFDSNRTGPYELYLMNPDGTNQRPITDLGGENAYPTWSPDGSRIAFNHADVSGGNYDIWIVNANGGNPRRITRGNADDFYPSWDPSGGFIFFDRCGSGECNVLAVEVSTGKLFLAASRGTHNYFSDTAPGGYLTAFATSDGNIWTIDYRDREYTNITQSSGIYLYPDWAPDRSSLVVAAWTGPGAYDLAFLGLDGAADPIPTGMDYNEDPDWQPVCSVTGTGGPDVLEGTGAVEMICGLGGRDKIDAKGDADLVLGGSGNDVLVGGRGNDVVIGGVGSDVLEGNAGFDFLWAKDGKRGNDELDGGPSPDLCYKDPDDVSLNCGS